jgi:hypothetical protein
MEKEAAISTILIIPKNQFYFSYKINEGISHVIKKEKAFNYFKEFITLKNYSLLSDYLSRFLPMIIFVSEDKIIELKKEASINNNYHHHKLEKEIESITKLGFQKKSKKEYLSNDKKVEKLCKKVNK